MEKCEVCGRSVEQIEDFVVAGIDFGGKVVKDFRKRVCPECTESLKNQLDAIIAKLNTG